MFFAFFGLQSKLKYLRLENFSKKMRIFLRSFFNLVHKPTYLRVVWNTNCAIWIILPLMVKTSYTRLFYRVVP